MYISSQVNKDAPLSPSDFFWDVRREGDAPAGAEARPAAAPAAPRAPSWLAPHILVKVIDKHLCDGRCDACCLNSLLPPQQEVCSPNVLNIRCRALGRSCMCRNSVG